MYLKTLFQLFMSDEFYLFFFFFTLELLLFIKSFYFILNCEAL